jgi:hypothetical protein
MNPNNYPKPTTSLEISTYPFQPKTKTSKDIQISTIFMNLKVPVLDQSRALSKEWNLRSRASDPRGENLRFSKLLVTLKSQIALTRHPELSDFLEESRLQVNHSVASGKSLTETLSQQRKELVQHLSRLEVHEIEKIYLNVFEIPKGFYHLIPLVQVEKKIEILAQITEQETDQSYDELTLDQIPAVKLTSKTKQLIEIVSILADLQDFDRIYALIQAHGQIKGALLGVLFDYLIHNNRLDQALEVARSVPMTGQKVALLLQLAQLYRQDPTQQAKSEEIFQEAYPYLDELTPKERQLVNPLAKNLLNDQEDQVSIYLD